MALLTLTLIALAVTLSAVFLGPSPVRQVPMPVLQPPPPPAGAEDVSARDAMISSLEEQNERLGAQVQSLQDALNGVTLDLEVARATRTELELQINGLREQLAQTQEELAFLKNAGNGATKP